MHVSHPFRFDSRGLTAEAPDEDAYVRGLIEQVLFTTPGERVNRPDFGSGLLQLVFAGASDALAAATRLSVQAALQQWLGDLIEVEAVETTREDATLTVTLRYLVRRTQRRQLARFEHPVAP
jgi:phage baseplate assembly protein W